MSVCWAEGCAREGSTRLVSKPVGTYSVAGHQPKLVATRYVFCDDHWAIIREAVAGDRQ